MTGNSFKLCVANLHFVFNTFLEKKCFTYQVKCNIITRLKRIDQTDFSLYQTGRADRTNTSSPV